MVVVKLAEEESEEVENEIDEIVESFSKIFQHS